MKHPPGSMGSCFIWQRTAEPPSFCPAVPSFLEFKQNNDCSSIGKQLFRVLRRNSRCSATTHTQGIDSIESLGQKQKSPLKTVTLQQRFREITCNSQPVCYLHICRYSNLFNFRTTTTTTKIFALLRAAQLSLILYILKGVCFKGQIKENGEGQKSTEDLNEYM